jgi:hypothetical protein
VALFPKVDPARKTVEGAEALDPSNLALRAIREVKAKSPGTVIFADISLDPYTTHGHDGILNAAGTDVDNDRTVEALVKMSLFTAQAGADFVAPSDMMDGRVQAIRKGLDASGHTGTGILAYSAKFASAFYGPVPRRRRQRPQGRRSPDLQGHLPDESGQSPRGHPRGDPRRRRRRRPPDGEACRRVSRHHPRPARVDEPADRRLSGLGRIRPACTPPPPRAGSTSAPRATSRSSPSAAPAPT